MSNGAQKDRDRERESDRSPTERSPFGFTPANSQFSRCSSNGSLHNISSPSAANSGSFFAPSPEDVGVSRFFLAIPEVSHTFSPLFVVIVLTSDPMRY